MMEQTGEKKVPLLEMQGFRVLFPGGRAPWPLWMGWTFPSTPGRS